MLKIHLKYSLFYFGNTLVYIYHISMINILFFLRELHSKTSLKTWSCHMPEWSRDTKFRNQKTATLLKDVCWTWLTELGSHWWDITHVFTPSWHHNPVSQPVHEIWPDIRHTPENADWTDFIHIQCHESSLLSFSLLFHGSAYEASLRVYIKP